MTTIDPADYWNRLSGSTMRLSDVGWPAWTESYNRSRYKLSLEQISAALHRHVRTPPRRILEVGCGVGFWTRALHDEYPAARITGLDISAQAISKLQTMHAGNPALTFQQADIATVALPEAGFDLAICLEVLLHVVDDSRWEAGIRAIGRSLAPGGIALISDPVAVLGAAPAYVEGTSARVRHLSQWTPILAESKLEIVSMQARTLLLDDNFDFRTDFGRRLWRSFFHRYNRLLKVQNETLGGVIGRAAYLVDKTYASLAPVGHSCKLLVLRKQD